MGSWMCLEYEKHICQARECRGRGRNKRMRWKKDWKGDLHGQYLKRIIV